MERYNEKAAADIILDRGVRINIPAPFFLRWFGKKEFSFSVKRPRYGTGLRISSYYIGTEIADEQLDNLTTYGSLLLYRDHGQVICKIVACGILNSWASGYLFTKVLAWYLSWNCTEERLCAIADFLVVFGIAKPFMNTIRSVRMLVITNPNLGQMTQGS